MRVDDDPLCVSQLGRDDVRGLARDAGELDQILESGRDLAVELLDAASRIVPRIDFVFCRKKPVA